MSQVHTQKVEYVKEEVQLVLGNLTHTYDGAEKAASVTTTPSNLKQSVTLTYDGVTTPPTASGNYTVVAFMNAPNYSGRQVGTMTISNPLAPSITSVLSANGTVGTAFSYQIAASNSPSGYGASGLPAGLSINAKTGLISGTPTTAGNSTVTLSASNAGGSGTASLRLRLLPR